MYKWFENTVHGGRVTFIWFINNENTGQFDFDNNLYLLCSGNKSSDVKSLSCFHRIILEVKINRPFVEKCLQKPAMVHEECSEA